MVQRQSQEVRFTSGAQQPEISRAAPGAAPLARGSASSREIDIDGDTTSRLLQGLLGTAQQVTDKLFDRHLQEEYLRGAAAVGQGKAESELEGSALTRDWAVAGFRDTAGKLQMAQTEAQMAADMKRLREQSPADFQKYLAQRRADITPTFEGMSFEQRQAAFGKLLLSDQAAIQKHKTEHAEWQIEQRMKPIQASTAAAIQNLEAARLKNDSVAYETALSGFIGTVYADINFDAAFDASAREKLNMQVASALFAGNQIAAAEALMNTPMPAAPDGTGERTTLLSRMSLESQEKYGNMLRTAYDRTEDMRNIEWRQQDAASEAAMSRGTFDLTYNEYDAFLQSGLQRGALKGGQYASKLKAFEEYQYNELRLHNLSQAALTGDVGRMASLNANEEDIVSAALKVAQRRGDPLESQIGMLASIGTKGFATAYKRMGELVAPAFRVLVDDKGNVNASQAQLVQTTLKMVEGFEAQGYQNASAQFLAGLPEDARSRAQSLMYELKRGGDAAQAVQATLAKEATTKNLSAQGRAQMAANLNREVQKELADFTGTRGFFSSLFQSVIQTEGGTLERPVHWFAQSEAAAGEAAFQARSELQASVERISRDAPHLTASQVVEQAKADLFGRTVVTKDGPLFAPPGTTIGNLYNVPVAVQSQIGRAVDNISGRYKREFPNTAAVRYENYHGQISVIGVDEDGTQTFARPLLKEELHGELAKFKDRAADVGRAEMGSGIEVRGVRFNGANSAGVYPSVMLEFRKNLIQHEGVVTTATPDAGNGKLNIGVAVNEGNDFFPRDLNLKKDDPVPPEVIRSSFLAASDDAAKDGVRIAQSAGLRGRAAQLLAMELTYQSGRGHVKDHAPVYAAIRAGDAERAVQEFRNTPAGKFTEEKHKERFDSYVKLIRQAANQE